MRAPLAAQALLCWLVLECPYTLQQSAPTCLVALAAVLRAVLRLNMTDLRQQLRAGHMTDWRRQLSVPHLVLLCQQAHASCALLVQQPLKQHCTQLVVRCNTFTKRSPGLLLRLACFAGGGCRDYYDDPAHASELQGVDKDKYVAGELRLRVLCGVGS